VLTFKTHDYSYEVGDNHAKGKPKKNNEEKFSIKNIEVWNWKKI